MIFLGHLPGIAVQQRGPNEWTGGYPDRRWPFQQVLIILDGRRLNDPLTGPFNGYIPVSHAEIERIEIVKGASSAIYGMEAVGVFALAKLFLVLTPIV